MDQKTKMGRNRPTLPVFLRSLQQRDCHNQRFSDCEPFFRSAGRKACPASYFASVSPYQQFFGSSGETFSRLSGYSGAGAFCFSHDANATQNRSGRYDANVKMT
jgi:hypothetical protein